MLRAHRTLLAAAGASLLLSAPALAEDRPSEADLFSAPAEASAAPSEKRPDEAELTGAAPSPSEGRPAESDIFGSEQPSSAEQPAEAEGRPTEASFFTSDPRPTRLSEEAAPEDPLKIGGQLYLRGAVGAYSDQPPSMWTLSAPTLVDGYFDARPNDRVRGMLVARMSYDPTRPEATESSSPFAVSSSGPGPHVALDQLWLRFDIERTVFLTAGKQHVKWGTARFWNPTDFLHSQQRDPLAVFDERTGVTMLKAHVPWEKTGANFYAIGLFEDVAGDGTLGKVGGAARAEMVVGSAEFGIDAYAQRGHKPKLGFDFSAGVWELDLYGEVAVRKGNDTPLYRRRDPPIAELGLEGIVEAYDTDKVLPTATIGGSWSARYNDEDVLTLGAEYFYNSLGAPTSEIYPWLMYRGEFEYFYTGRHYAGAYAVLMAPGSWNNTNFVLSTLGNLSDRSFTTRLDYSLKVLTHLQFEAWGAAYYGHKGGEFRFSFEMPETQIGGETYPAVSIPAPLFQAGLGLRVNI